MDLKHNYEGLKRALVQERGVRTRQQRRSDCVQRGRIRMTQPMPRHTLSTLLFADRLELALEEISTAIEVQSAVSQNVCGDRATIF